uniref:Glutamate/phenylalanine/leucine/valine/L-tryptophan dehydrogenase C-terminal domain-containing protein n=1 Tax=Chromera velia CCMP2878 TaxID=1169474 RepID=A0A0G4I0F7_9ALVE|eukprot:Cvel_9941.t1-p1 / transcript=Cvel_9941.t1 / gene=Cvel_9941 / organism=Chromera_velia_CCMP2878 / gene_product=Glutamate dehydrogenase 2, putative / transcript_product=Glutamate dehydrogenase 2, putative / location=Cvel_scaffold588:39304-43867(+) / protein_length=1083 / sequence_SO=supercontig / SO=protein_coding / is_pseudo=false
MNGVSLQPQKSALTRHGTCPGRFNRDGLVSDLHTSLKRSSESIVPHFLDVMPTSYFRETPYTTVLEHLKSLVALDASGVMQDVTLRSPDGLRLTVIHRRSYRGQLRALLRGLPRDRPLRSAHVYSASDDSLIVDVFEFVGHGESPTRVQAPIDFLDTVPEWEEQVLEPMLTAVRRGEEVAVDVRPCPEVPKNFVFALTLVSAPTDCRELFEKVSTFLSMRSLDIIQAHFWEEGGAEVLSFEVRACGAEAFAQAVKGEEQRQKLQADLRRVVFMDAEALRLHENVSVWSLEDAELILGLCHLNAQRLAEENARLFRRQLVVETAALHPQCLSKLAAAVRAKFEPGGVHEGSDALIAKAGSCIGRTARDPVDKQILDGFIVCAQSILKTNLFVETRRGVSFRIRPNLMHEATETDGQVREDVPFGVFFVHGRGFDGFHVRFRDISRGGVRLVLARGPEQMAVESGRFYRESWGLARAQQMKNKDIPEGGSKAVVLVAPPPAGDCGFALRGFVDGLLDLITPEPSTKSKVVDLYARPEFLYLGPDENVSDDLILWIADRAKARGYGQPSAFISSKPSAGINHKQYGVTSEGVVVFLEEGLKAIGKGGEGDRFTVKITGGPDGDVAGNALRLIHQKFGERARVLGIADGSGVAEDPVGLCWSELIRLVDRALPICEFDKKRLSDRGEVLGVSEGGLEKRNSLHNRLQTDVFLPAGGRPATINKSNWHEFLIPDPPAQQHQGTTPKEASGWVSARSATGAGHSHHHGEVSGGGRPSSQLIVEGANLFLTAEAREFLSASGVLIFKDSSANKCGVVASSLEIAACVLLDADTKGQGGDGGKEGREQRNDAENRADTNGVGVEQEEEEEEEEDAEMRFLRLKDRYVVEVLDRLRSLARQEAKCLLRAKQEAPQVSLPSLSEELSRTVIQASDVLAGWFRSRLQSDEQLAVWRPLLDRTLPSSLLSEAGNALENPSPAVRAYVTEVLASSLASRMAYREGLSFLRSLVGGPSGGGGEEKEEEGEEEEGSGLKSKEGVRASRLLATASRYLDEELRVDALVLELEKKAAEIPCTGEVVKLLRQGGVRAALEL